MSAVAVAMLATIGVLSCHSDDPPRPNVIIVSIDTLNRSALRAYDSTAPELPRIERFAAESLVFDNAHSTSSWTLPAHASLLTGLYPVRHGATNEHVRINSAVDTLASDLRRLGYDTVGFSGGGFLDDSYGFDTGFDRYNDEVSNPGFEPIELPRNGQYTTVPGSSLFDRTIAFLRGRKSRAPFFAFVQTYSVHEYYNVRPWAAEQFPGRRFASPGHYMACLDGDKRCSPEDWSAMRDLYRAELHHLDDGFGRLLDAIDAAGLRESTFVFFVSDHGEGFDPEHGRIHHGGRLNADLIRVPLLVRGPGVTPSRAAQAVSLVDFMPTVLELVGTKPDRAIDGRSFASVLHGSDELEERPLYATEYNYDWRNGRRRESKEIRSSAIAVAVITGDHWYIRGSNGVEEFYQNSADPMQLHNLVGEPVDLTHHRELAEARLKLHAPIELVAKDASTVEQLRKLGYVDR